MKRFFIITALIFALSSAFSQTPLDTAVNFEVKDTNGNIIELFDLLDQDYIVIVDFFRTDCGYCNIYAPDFQASYEDFGCNSSNVFFMSIDQGHTNEDVIAFEEEHNLTLPACSGLDGNGNAAFEAFQITGTPTYVVIAPDKEILEQQIWPPVTDSINNALLEAGGIMASCLTGVDDAKKVENPILYPNPVNSHSFNIDQSQISEEIDRIEIRSITGQLVHTQKYRQKISVSHITKGIYFVNLFSKGHIISKEKIVIR